MLLWRTADVSEQAADRGDQPVGRHHSSMCAYAHTSLCSVFFLFLVCVFVCVLRSPTVAQGQTWSAMLRFCGHPDQQITGLWLPTGCKSSNKPHGWRGMLQQAGSSGDARLQPLQFVFTGRASSLEELRGAFRAFSNTVVISFLCFPYVKTSATSFD